jgi:ParB family chromosome partitioning protein
MSKSSVLGRGLGNLIPGSGNKNLSQQESSVEDSNAIVKEIKISEVQLNPNQPRKTFSAETISELAETIKVHGLIQPIIVKKTESGFELVAGERRLRACKEAGFVKIQAIVKNYTVRDSMEVSLLENIQREDLNPIEEALAYQALSERMGLKVTEIAARIGKNRSTIANLIRLLQLPEAVREMVASKKLSEGQARPLLSIGDKKKLEEVAKKIYEQSLTVREVEELIAKITDGKRSEKSKSSRDPSIVMMESRIRTKFSAKVSVSHNEKSGKGKIVLSYANMNELDRILEKMGIR